MNKAKSEVAETSFPDLLALSLRPLTLLLEDTVRFGSSDRLMKISRKVTLLMAAACDEFAARFPGPEGGRKAMWFQAVPLWQF